VPRAWRGAAVLLLTGLIAAVPTIAHAERTLGISTATFDFSVAAGQTVSGELYVINNGDEPLTVMVYAADQVVDETGGVTYVTPGRDDRGGLSSVASWVQLRLPAETKTIGNTPYLEMDPGEQTLVQFDLAVPAQAPAGDHGVLLFFEMFDLEQAVSGTGTVVGGRIGSFARIRVQGDLVEKIDVSRFVVPGFVIGDWFDYSCVISNGGNIDKRVDAALAVVNGAGEEALRSDVATDTTVYAGQVLERSGRIDTPALIGKRTVRVTVSYDPEAGDGSLPREEVVAERAVWFIPWWLFITVVATLGVLAVWLSWRQSVKMAERKRALKRAERLERRNRIEARSHDLGHDVPEHHETDVDE